MVKEWKGWKEIGEFSVDSGQLLLVDPCYLNEWVDDGDDVDFNKFGEFSYDGACSETSSEKGYGQLGGLNALVVSTGYGDGVYPVYAKKNEDGRISEIKIVFIEDEDLKTAEQKVRDELIKILSAEDKNDNN